MGLDAATAFVAKVCAAGELRWSVGYPAAAGVKLHAVVSDESGGAWIAGSFTGTLSVGAPPSTEETASGAAGFLEHVASNGSTDRRVALPAPVLALALDATSSTAPLAAVLGSAPQRALFSAGACADSAPIDATGLHVLRLDPSGACLDRKTCSAVATAADDTPVALQFDAQGGLVFVAPFDAPAGAALHTCGENDAMPAMAGTHGLVVARAPSSGDFDPMFGIGRVPDYVAAGPLFTAIDPNDQSLWVAGTTRATFSLNGLGNAEAPHGNDSMFLLRFAPMGNPEEVVAVDASVTTGSSRAGSIAFGPSGQLSAVASIRGVIGWQNGTTLTAGKDDDRLLLTNIARSGGDSTFAFRLDPRRSLAPLPFVVGAPGCAPVLATSFGGGIGAASGELIATGLDVAIVPGVDALVFPTP